MAHQTFTLPVMTLACFLSCLALGVTTRVPSHAQRAAHAAAEDTFSMTPRQYWRGPYGEPPRFALTADVTGEGRADMISVGPPDDTRIEVARTSALGKSAPSFVASDGLG